MTPEQQKRLEEARIKWRSDPRHQSTCNHVSQFGGGSMLFETETGEVWHNSYRCKSCGVAVDELVAYRKGGEVSVLLRHEKK